MSAIDMVDHVHVADFYGIPVYWINGKIFRRDLTNANSLQVLDNQYISIGGGSGEHPALIINLEAAIESILTDIDYDYSNTEKYFIDMNDWTYEDFKIIESQMPDVKYKFSKLIKRIVGSVGIFAINELPCETFIKNKEIYSSYNDEGLCVYGNDYFGFTGVLPSRCGGKQTVNGKTVFKYSLQEWYINNKNVKIGL